MSAWHPEIHERGEGRLPARITIKNQKLAGDLNSQAAEIASSPTDVFHERNSQKEALLSADDARLSQSFLSGPTGLDASLTALTGWHLRRTPSEKYVGNGIMRTDSYRKTTPCAYRACFGRITCSPPRRQRRGLTKQGKELQRVVNFDTGAVGGHILLLVVRARPRFPIRV